MRLFNNLRARLIFLVLIAVVPALAISLTLGLEQRKQARDKAVNDAYRFTRLAVQYEISLISQTEQMFTSLALSAELSDRAVCEASLKRLVDFYPMYTSLSAIAADMSIICTTPISGEISGLLSGNLFERAVADRKIVSGTPVILPDPERLIMPVLMPVFDPAGEVHLFLAASLNMDVLASYAAQLNLPAQSAMILVDQEGRVLQRYPESEEWVGLRLPDVPIIQKILNTPGEGTGEAQGIDGQNRLFAFSGFPAVSGDDVYVSIGIPTAYAYADANRVLRQSLIWTGTAALIALLAAWFGGDVFFLRVVSLTAERDAAEQKLRNANEQLEARVKARTEELAQVNERLEVELVERKQMVETLRMRELELRKLNRLLERSNRDLQDFAYITSHDLQEPLRKIQAFGERLQRRYADNLDKDGRMFIERMYTSANRMQAMINDLLEYSRVDSRARAFAPVSLNQVIAEVLSNLEMRIEETHAVVEVGDLPVVEGDAIQLQQVLQNLIGNALKFHRDNINPQVQVSAEIQPDLENQNGSKNVEVCVSDNGIGFDVKYADRIFLPFQRLHSKDVYEGSGIGLAICRKIVDRHGGTISVRSRLGEGSQFKIILPLKQNS